jgi:hypothetical protein
MLPWLIVWALLLSTASIIMPAVTWLLRRDLILDRGVVGSWIALQTVTCVCLGIELLAPPLPALGWLVVDGVWTAFLALGMAYHKKLSHVPTVQEATYARQRAADRRARAHTRTQETREEARNNVHYMV